MAYPIIPAPYGLKPINLIGGQVFAGSTRNVPIQYNYGNSIFYGDLVSITRGFAVRLPATTGATAATGAAGYGQVGVFLGCSYTNPLTKQKFFSQYWPANTLAGDAVAIVTDDPDTIFRMAVVTAQGGTTVGSVASAMVGLNMNLSDVAGNVNNGDSNVGALSSSGAAPATTAAFPVRIVGVVQETAISLGTATLTSGGGTTSLVTSAVPSALPYGTEVGYLAANGQYIGTGSWVSAAVSAGGTTVGLNAQAGTVNLAGVTSSAATIPNSSTLVFTQYQEVLVKLNFGFHSYYNATGTQTA